MHITVQMELSWNGSSSVPDYSEDTFASFSEGEEYENDPFESYYSGEESEWPAASDLSESTWQSSSQNDEGQEPESLDSTAVGEYLTRKWISLLKDNGAITGLAKSTFESENALTGITKVSEEELGPLQSFCAIKINQLCHLPSSAPPNRNKHKDQRNELTLEKSLMCGLNSVVSDPLVNRLRLKNLKETMKQLAEIEIHQPSQCPYCMKKRAELSKAAFLQRRKTLMEQFLLQEKLEEHIYTKDSLTLIGEIHRSLPKLFEDPRNIWKKLNEIALKA